MSFAELRGQADPGTLELQLYRGRLSIAETSVRLRASARMQSWKSPDKIGKPNLQESIVEGVVRGGDRDNSSSSNWNRSTFLLSA